MKNYPVKIKSVEGIASPNRYQEDFLYLKTLAEEVVPLEDRYFPQEKRAALELWADRLAAIAGTKPSATVLPLKGRA